MGIRLTVSLLLTVAAAAHAQGVAERPRAASAAPTATLQASLEGLAKAHHGRTALFAKHLSSGEIVALDADVPVKTASTIKVPIMIEAFLEAKEGKRALTDTVVLRDDEKVYGSGAFHFMHAGLALTLEDTIWNMMLFSDNTATNLVIDALGTDAVNQRMARLGLKETWLYKKIGRPATPPMQPDQPRFGLGKTTARDMGRLLEWLARCEAQDEAMCRKMIRIMRNQQDRSMLARHLETQDTTEAATPSYVAAKWGGLDEVRNEVGILYTASGPIVVAAFTWDNEDQRWTPDNTAQLLVAAYAREIVSAWSPGGMQKTGEIPRQP